MQLRFMLPRELLVLPLELCDQDLPLNLLLLLEGQQLLLQLLLPQRRLRHWHGELVIQPQVHGHRARRHLQGQGCAHVNCGGEHESRVSVDLI